MSENRSEDKFGELLRFSLDRQPGMEPPPGLPAAMVKLVAYLPDKGGAEAFATRALVGIAILAAGACVTLQFDLIASPVGELLDRAPWPLLLTAAAAIGAIRLEELISRVTSRPRS
jgi:hypothetical protein